jgi:hypothetical protein
MDFNLKDLGATLVTGAYFLLGVVFLLHVIFGWNFLVFLRLAKRVSSVALTILTLSLAFGAGMLLEDLSNKFVDSGAAKIPILGWRLLPLDEALRTETLFGKEFLNTLPTEKAKEDESAKPAGLSRAAAKLKLLEKHGPEGMASQRAVLSKEPKVTREAADEAASRLYYEAKNTVYAVNNHYDELKQIQTRIDFSRSFSLLSLALAAVCVICSGIALVVPDFGARIAQRFRGHRNQKPAALRRRAVVVRVLVLLLVLVSIYYVGRFAYRSEEIEFNKRAYGYFLTLAAAKTNTHATLSASPIGYSGLARINQSTFLVAHDTKSESGEARLGTLLVQPGSTPLYVPLKVDWGADPPNDFEAVSAVPGQEREFLVTESGYEGGKFGRVFHIVLTKGLEQWNVTVKGTIFLPKDTENIEGLTCVRNAAGELILLLGERGGSNQNPTGKIRWAALDLIAYRMQVLGEKNLVVPSQIVAGQKGVRACADLYLDDRQQLWSVATQDRSDDGPFRSVIYQAGTIDPSAPEPFHLLQQINAAWILDGVKVEGIGASPIENSPISIATDDENYEGIWRPLFPASTDGAKPR